MILVLDVGNTNIVLGCIDGEAIYFEGRMATDPNKTEMEYAVMFKNILDIYDVNQDLLEGAIISSVVPPLNDVLSRAVHAVTGFFPIEVDVHQNTGLKIDTDHPEELGNDLIVTAVAALQAYEPPMIIIDMGTATTFSIIDKNGLLIGAVLMPGVKISQEALSGRTAQLPEIRMSEINTVIGKNTVDCMKIGMIHGSAAMIDGMVDRIEDELGMKTTVIATGGLAGAITKHCKHEILYQEDLLIRGLWILYQRNKPQ